MTRKRNNANHSNHQHYDSNGQNHQSTSRTTALQSNSNSNNTTPIASGASTPTSESASDSWVDKDGKTQHLPKKIVLERTSLQRPSLVGSKGFGSQSGLKRSTSYKLKAPGTPFDELDLSEVPWLVGEDQANKGIFKYRRLFLLAGILLGAVLAWGVSQHSAMEHHIASFKSIVDEQLTGLGIDISNLDLSLRIPTEYADLGDKLFSNTREWLTTKDFQVGRRLLSKGYKAEHPVILLPGIISTGLESWSTNEDSSGNFRKRLWGTSTMFRMVVLEKELWIKQLSLDPDTGLDPPGIKVRAAEGLDAASYFVTGYWIWSKVIENLAAIGYDTNNLYLASFDWRLSYHNLEVRDHFFTRLKLQIEQNSILHQKKTVLVAHSMGSSVAMYFMKWVEASGPGFGNGGPTWVEDHLESFTSIAGTFLGVPKTMAALLSGEMRDTVELPPAGAYLLEKFFSRAERARLFRTWAGSASMVIKGGESVWGNQTWAPDDDEEQIESHGKVYSFKLPHPKAKDPKDVHSKHLQSNLTADDAITYLLQHSPTSFQKMMESNYSNGIERDEKQLELNDQDSTKWANPLEARLPNAPNLKIYCMYGVGKPTERSYWYEQGLFQRAETVAEGETAQCAEDDDCKTKSSPLEFPLGRSNKIDSSIHNETSNPIVRAGCKMADGDGTVSLLSLGAMCEEGWKRKRYNPGGAKVVTHELLHEPDSLDLRGGEHTGDHVDLLGSRRINEYVLKVAAGRGDEIERNVVSRIEEFARKIKWDSA